MFNIGEGLGGFNLSKIKISVGQLTVKQFEYLYQSTNWKPFLAEQIEKSLENDRYHVSAWVNQKIVGMGRLVGDASMYWYIQNLIVLPEYQCIGVGAAIMENLLTFIRKNSPSNSHIVVGLMCSENTALFYQKFGFNIRPCGDLGPGATLEMDL